MWTSRVPLVASYFFAWSRFDESAEPDSYFSLTLMGFFLGGFVERYPPGGGGPIWAGSSLRLVAVVRLAKKLEWMLLVFVLSCLEQEVRS